MRPIYVDLRRSTSIYVYLCQEIAKMMDQICKNRRTNKEIPIHNGTHKGGPAAEGGRPTFVGGGRMPPPIMGVVGMYLIVFS